MLINKGAADQTLRTLYYIKFTQRYVFRVHTKIILLANCVSVLD